jgi:hypothetical protein
MMQWASANGCEASKVSWCEVCNAAAAYGHLPCLKWVAPKAGAGGLTWWGCTAHRCCVRVTLVRL